MASGQFLCLGPPIAWGQWHWEAADPSKPAGASSGSLMSTPLGPHLDWGPWVPVTDLSATSALRTDCSAVLGEEPAAASSGRRAGLACGQRGVRTLPGRVGPVRALAPPTARLPSSVTDSVQVICRKTSAESHPREDTAWVSVHLLPVGRGWPWASGTEGTVGEAVPVYKLRQSSPASGSPAKFKAV